MSLRLCDLQITPGCAMMPGYYREGKIRCTFCTDLPFDNSLYLVLVCGKDKLQIDLQPFCLSGKVYCVCVTGDLPENTVYYYLCDQKVTEDPYRVASYPHRKFKKKLLDGEEHALCRDSFDFAIADCPRIAYENIISYRLNVRAFTAHSSSLVTHKGTFAGITEKIPYLQSLQINQLEIMPAYDFYEWDQDASAVNISRIPAEYMPNTNKEQLNCWGFKWGYYLSVKPGYSSENDPAVEFAAMVDALHKAGIELIMQFYFPKNVNRNYIAGILRFWTMIYKVDGFRLLGDDLPFAELATDPYLSASKLYVRFCDKDAIVNGPNGYNKYIAFSNDDYLTDMRRFLKSDEDMLKSFMYRQILNPSDMHVINYITSYEGFTLHDCVSYDHKHNEDNHEDNRDGINYNYSWNCGAEGVSRKKNVLHLRMKQMKNAFLMLLLSQGVVQITAGDEIANTQRGNNNPYCQDNDLYWIDWKMNSRSSELLSFVINAINFRKMHPVLHMPSQMRVMDYRGVGYPDLSYHSDAAWECRTDNYYRHIGIMLCGKYADPVDDFIYIAYNMHWESHEFGLPKLPKGLRWRLQICTDDTICDTISDNLQKVQDRVKVSDRSIAVLVSEPVQ